MNLTLGSIPQTWSLFEQTGEKVEKVTCNPCNGKGYRICGRCDGKKNWREETKKFNRLTGLYETTVHEHTCTTCDNQGRVKCSHCETQGYYYERIEYREYRFGLEEVEFCETVLDYDSGRIHQGEKQKEVCCTNGADFYVIARSSTIVEFGSIQWGSKSKRSLSEFGRIHDSFHYGRGKSTDRRKVFKTRRVPP